MSTRRSLLPAALVVAGALITFAPLCVRGARASCDVIPGTEQSFRGELGSLDRPFAAPGTLITVSLDRGAGACDQSSPGFQVSPAPRVSDLVITVAFASGAPELVVMAPSCGIPPFNGCTASSSPPCLCVETDDDPEDQNNVDLVDAATLRFRFPDSDARVGSPADGATLAGPARIAVTAASNESILSSLGTTPCADLIAQGTPLLACADRLFERDGGCGVEPHAVFSQFTALPRANDYAAVCTDPAPPCLGTADELRFALDGAGNALIPMDWRGVLVRDERVPVPRLLRGASGIEAFPGSSESIAIPGPAFLGSYSTIGTKLPPIFDPQRDETAPDALLTLFGSADAPETVLRIARRQRAAACIDGGRDGFPCATASECPGGSCQSRARFLACVADPDDTRACTRTGGCPCTADSDCPCAADGTCAAGRCAPTVCSGGARSGSACGIDLDCPGGECGPALFDFASRRLDGKGPVVMSATGSGGVCVGGSTPERPCEDDAGCAGGVCRAFSLQARDPVPLEGLVQGAFTNAFVVSEAIRDADRNGDGDQLDDVAQLFDRVSGRPLLIGTGAGDPTPCSAINPGRAVTRVRSPPFSFPVLALDDRVAALFESEAGQGALDTNENGQVLEPILRVFGLDELDDCPPDLLPGLDLAVDAAPVFDGRSLAVEAGRVFFRVPVASNARRATTHLSRSASIDGAPGDDASRDPALSHSGRFVTFSSHACDLIAGDCIFTNDVEDVLLHDRDADGDGVLDEPEVGATATVLLSASTEDQADSPSRLPAISADGRSVVFQSLADNLDSFDDDVSICPEPDPDPADCNSANDIYVWQADDPVRPVRRLTIDVGGEDDADGASEAPAISEDGRFVAFESTAFDLVPGDGSVRDVFVHDRDPDRDGVLDERIPDSNGISRVSVSFAGGSPNGESRNAAISADGRFVAFDSTATDLLAVADPSAIRSVFVRDRDADQDGIFDEAAPGAMKTVPVSVSSDGERANGASLRPSISADGRVVVFESTATNLVAGDTSTSDVFVHLRDADGNGILDESGGIATEKVSRALAGGAASGESSDASLSADGRFITFSSLANDLTVDDPTDADPPNPSRDVFLHDRFTGVTALISKRAGGSAANGASQAPAISGDGHFVVFASAATNLQTPTATIDDDNAATDVLVRGPGADLVHTTLGEQPADASVLSVLDASVDPAAVTLLCPASEASVADAGVAFLGDEAACAAAMSASDLSAPARASASVGGADDLVVHLWTSAGGLVSLDTPARSVAASSSWIAALVPETTSSGSADANGDGDTQDLVLAVHPFGAGAWSSSGRAASKIRIAGSHVAFLSPEVAQGDGSLNGDGDSKDVVLHVLDAEQPGQLVLGPGGTPTRSARDFVIGGTSEQPIVAFHVDEADEGEALNDDGDGADQVLAVFDVVSGLLIDTGLAVTPCRLEACDPRVPYRVGRDTVTFLTFEGDHGSDLSGDGDTNDLVLQILNVRTAAAALAAAASASTTGGDVARTHAAHAASAGATTVIGVVEPGGSLAVPLADLGPGKVLEGAGRCVLELDASMSCESSSDCPSGQVCAEAQCRIEAGVCERRRDCPDGFRCLRERLLAVAADSDADELPDPIDNCPTRANIAQVDRDGDGVGNQCEPRCGNGIVEPGEACDGGSAACCTNTCKLDLCRPCGRCDATTRSCVARVLDTCRRPTSAGASELLIQDTSPNSLDTLRWVWGSGQATPLADFGDPTASEDYELCVFQGDESSSILFRAAVPAVTKWKVRGRNPVGKRGYRFKKAAPSESGLTLLHLKPGAEGEASITAEGRGERLRLLGPVAPPLRVQLQSESGRCWEECYESSGLSVGSGKRWPGSGGCP